MQKNRHLGTLFLAVNTSKRAQTSSPLLCYDRRTELTFHVRFHDELNPPARPHMQFVLHLHIVLLNLAARGHRFTEDPLHVRPVVAIRHEAVIAEFDVQGRVCVGHVVVYRVLGWLSAWGEAGIGLV